MAPAQERSVDPAGNSAAFPSSTKMTRGIGGIVFARSSRRGGELLEGSVGHVGAAHQRSGLDVVKAEGSGFVAEDGELVGGVVAADGVVVAGGREVLAEGDD